MVEFVASQEMFQTDNPVKKKSRRKKKNQESEYNKIPSKFRWADVEAVPAVPGDRCEVDVYTAPCPSEDCDYSSGRYVSRRGARLALWGHFRWVHKWLG